VCKLQGKSAWFWYGAGGYTGTAARSPLNQPKPHEAGRKVRRPRVVKVRQIHATGALAALAPRFRSRDCETRSKCSLASKAAHVQSAVIVGRCFGAIPRIATRRADPCVRRAGQSPPWRGLRPRPLRRVASLDNGGPRCSPMRRKSSPSTQRPNRRAGDERTDGAARNALLPGEMMAAVELPPPIAGARALPARHQPRLCGRAGGTRGARRD
jgi:hypothetical protein